MSFDPAIYHAFEQLTERMADAAEKQDFEQLSALGVDYESLSAQIATAGAGSPAEIASVETSIRNILNYQQRISEHTGPWLEHIRGLLRENRQEKSLIDTYRTAI